MDFKRTVARNFVRKYPDHFFQCYECDLIQSIESLYFVFDKPWKVGESRSLLIMCNCCNQSVDAISMYDAAVAYNLKEQPISRIMNRSHLKSTPLKVSDEPIIMENCIKKP